MAILYLGQIVEIGPTKQIVTESCHPYARALVAAVPVPGPSIEKEHPDVRGELPDQINLPPGCRFAPRCSKTFALCTKTEPEARECGAGHWGACRVKTL